MGKQYFLKHLFIFFVIFATACDFDAVSKEMTQIDFVSNSSQPNITVQKIQWTAYKTSAKTPVHGVFKNVELSQLQDTKDILAALEGAKIKILVSSLDSENEERDAKILRFFFGSLRFSNTITGTITQIDALQKKMTVDLLFNEITYPVVLDYTLAQNIMVLEGIIALADFNALAALSALHQACFELHKGMDGKSHLWDSVAIQAILAIQ